MTEKDICEVCGRTADQYHKNFTYKNDSYQEVMEDVYGWESRKLRRWKNVWACQKCRREYQTADTDPVEQKETSQPRYLDNITGKTATQEQNSESSESTEKETDWKQQVAA